ncbi:hypothetical protein V1514DRAFT_329546 [Lipomyces japonicus]|uniref:uncharacterized protein n=1 Tax=Lipomyces japonicus TaxID=56871 RepID=UPI0034CE55AB
MTSTFAELRPVPAVAPITERIQVAPFSLFCHLTNLPSPVTNHNNNNNNNNNRSARHAIVLHVTSSESIATPLTVFVYALPPQPYKSQPLTTTLLGGQTSSSQESQEFAIRLAKILAKQTGRPVYVGASISSFVDHIESFEKITQFVTQNLHN